MPGRTVIPNWLAGLPKKDADSWKTFVHLHEQPLRGWVTQLIKNAHDANDIVQETFLRAYRSGRGFESEAYARNWLYRVAANLCADRGRERRRHIRVSLDYLKEVNCIEFPDSHSLSPDLYLEEVEEERARTRELAEAMRQVPSQYRLVLFLRYYMGMKRGDIAAQLGIKDQDVSNRLHRGLEKLREYFGAAV